MLVLEPFDAEYERLRKADPGAEIAPGVLLVRGPPPVPGWHPPAPLSAPTAGSLLSWTAWSFLVLAVAGLGWAWGLLRLPWLDRLALAPAIGLGALIAGGFVVGMQGVTLRAGAGRWTAAGVAAAGWLAGAGRWAWERWRRKDPEPAP